MHGGESTSKQLTGFILWRLHDAVTCRSCFIPQYCSSLIPDIMSTDKLDKERLSYRAQLDQALQEDEDPLAAYDTFIKWTLSSYSGDLISRSGLVELLEEVTRTFKDDATYKRDLRYLKMWCMYASAVEHPALVLEFVLRQGIGTGYAQVYEDYALALEQIGRYVHVCYIFSHPYSGYSNTPRIVDPMQTNHTNWASNVALVLQNV